jgi:prepilin-type N-terminal cleavage/methylation domain-containing protein
MGHVTQYRFKTGFTLIDMMIAVAILSILAAVAYPQIAKMKARGIQLTAKTELMTLYIAQKNFREIYKTYSVDWQAAGFTPKGMNLTGLYPVSIDRNRAYAIYNGNQQAPVPTTLAALGLASGIPWPTMYPAHYSRCQIVGNNNATTYPGIDTADTALGAPIAFISKTTFRATSIGCPMKNLTTTTGLDRWTIDQDAVIQQLNSGI